MLFLYAGRRKDECHSESNRRHRNNRVAGEGFKKGSSQKAKPNLKQRIWKPRSQHNKKIYERLAIWRRKCKRRHRRQS